MNYDEERAKCFNCGGQGVIPDMEWIRSASDEELNDPKNTPWIQCPECHGTGYC